MKKWCIWQTPLYNKPSGPKVLDLPAYALIEVIDHQDGWSFVQWMSNENKPVVGWVNDDLIEEYASEFPTGLIAEKRSTPNPNDSQQNIIYLGNAQYNLCGEYAICYVAGWKFAIEDWLDEWKIKQTSVFNRVFQGGRSRGTGLTDLDSMLSSFEGFEVPAPRLDKAMTRSAPMIAKYTPGRVAKVLKTHYIIAGCKIGVDGRLRGQGVGHWVALDKIMPDRVNGGWIELYNSAFDGIERYSWREFIASAGLPFGVLAKRGGRDESDH